MIAIIDFDVSKFINTCNEISLISIRISVKRWIENKHRVVKKIFSNSSSKMHFKAKYLLWKKWTTCTSPIEREIYTQEQTHYSLIPKFDF